MTANARSGQPAVIAVEGLCFAGKTTLSRALARQLPAGVVAEYADLAPLPDFPPASVLAVRQALRHFLAVEQARSKIARQLRAPIVFCDRCPLTLIAHEHAMASLGQLADPHTAARWFSSAAAAGTITAPDAYLYLTIPERTFAARMASRGQLPDHLVSPAVRAAIGAVYDAYFTAAGTTRVLRLDGRADLAQLVQHTKRFVAGLPAPGTRPAPDWAMLASPAAIAARTAA